MMISIQNGCIYEREGFFKNKIDFVHSQVNTNKDTVDLFYICKKTENTEVHSIGL